MEKNAEGRQRRDRRIPVVLPLLDLDVLSADVDGVGSLMDGMTIVPSAPSVFSLASVASPVGIGAVHSFAPRSGDLSVLSALTAPDALSGRTVFGGGGAGFGGVTEGDGQSGILGGGLERTPLASQDATNW